MGMLPLLCALLGLVAWIVELLPAGRTGSDTSPPASPPALPWLAASSAVVLLTIVTLAGTLALTKGAMFLAFGLATGGLLTIVAALLEQKSLVSHTPSTLAPIGAATLVVSLLSLIPDHHAIAYAGALIGSGLAAGLVGRSVGTWNRSAASSTALLIASGSALMLLGAMRPEERLHQLWMLTWGLVALTALILRGIALAGPAAAKLRLPIGLLLIGGAGAALGQYSGLPSGMLLPILGSGAALLLGVLIPEEQSAPGQALLGTLIGIAVATVAFGFAQGTGMSLTGLCMAALLIASGRPYAAIAAAPCVLLGWHRVLQEYGDLLNSTLNPNQHYVLIGLLLGAGVPALLAQQTHDEPEDANGPWWWIPAGLLGILIAAASPLLLADRAATGFLAGAAIASLIGLMSVPTARTIPAMSALVIGVAFLAITLTPPEFLLTRDQKVTWLFIVGGLGLLLALPLALRRPKPESASRAAAREAV